MRHIFVRGSRPEEAKKFLDWSLNTPKNLFDYRVVLYPTTTTRAAFNKNGPVVFMPIQRPLMMESLAINPQADKVDVAMALKELTQDAVTTAFSEGRGEIYFLCHDDLTYKFALNHGFEEVPVKLFRMRIDALETLQQS